MKVSSDRAVVMTGPETVTLCLKDQRPELEVEVEETLRSSQGVTRMDQRDSEGGHVLRRDMLDKVYYYYIMELPGKEETRKTSEERVR